MVGYVFRFGFYFRLLMQFDVAILYIVTDLICKRNVSLLSLCM